ncbi:MAG: hypothetical protein ACXWWW_03225 [Candidatus Deferrimicrobiaceae bacterium]
MPASRKWFPPSSSPPPDHALFAEIGDLLVPEAEFRQNLLVVLPKPWGSCDRSRTRIPASGDIGVSPRSSCAIVIRVWDR